MSNKIVIDELKKALHQGKSVEVREKTIEALREQFSPQEIIKAMTDTMQIIGEQFSNNELFVPEVLLIGRAFNTSLKILEPLVITEMREYVGTIVIGTIKGDLHNIGKNLVRIMLEGAGFRVVDLGVNVDYEEFAEAIREYKPEVVAVSALLSTTMINLKGLVKYLNQYGLRDQVKIMVGGAPVTEAFAKDAGVDAYCPDAGFAPSIALDLLQEEKRAKYD